MKNNTMNEQIIRFNDTDILKTDGSKNQGKGGNKSKVITTDMWEHVNRE